MNPWQSSSYLMAPFVHQKKNLIELENSGKLVVSRIQALTANVKNSTFMTEGCGKKVLLRWSK